MSRLRSLLVALLAGVAATASLTAVAGSATAVDATPGYRVRSFSVDLLVGPQRDHRCTVVADLYEPDGAGPGDRAPAILTTHGFGGSKDDGNQTAVGRAFAQEGYVVLSYSSLGFGGSGCKIHLDDPDWDGRVGKGLVDVLAGGRTVRLDNGRLVRFDSVAEEAPGDPRVGMIGGSYGGQAQFAVAGLDDRVDALIPLITWNDLSYSLAPNNTSFRHGVSTSVPGVHKRQWTALFFGAGILDGVDDAQVDPARNVGCPNFVNQACVASAQLFALGYPTTETTEFARDASVAGYLHRITAPTLLVQGQKDTLFNLQEAIATYRGLRAQGTPVRMIWQSWGHSDGGEPAPGELDLGADSIRDSYLGRRFLAWMDHHVRGRDSAPVGPRFSYFRDWVRYDTSPGRAGRAVAKAYRTSDHFPVARPQRLYFSGSGRLVRARDRVRRGAQSYANASGAPTSYSETSGLEGSQVNRPPSDAPGTFAAWTTPPLDRAARIVGVPRLRVRLDAPTAAVSQRGGPAGQLVLFAKIYDVAPDGGVRLHNRLVSPVRVPDVTRPVTIELPGVVQRVPAGHRIRVVLAASDAAYAGNKAVHPVTVRTSRRAPSRLTLPIVGHRVDW